MKFNIHINQRAIIENNLNLDLVDAAILDFIHSWVVHGNIEKKDFYNDTFYWLDYKYMAHEMPMLGIKSKDGVYRRLKKMCDQGLLIPHMHNQAIGKPYFAFGPKFKLLLFHNPTDNDPNGPYKSPNGSRIQSERRTDEKSDNNNIKDNSIRDKKDFFNLPFKSEEFKNAWNNWIADRNERRKKVTKRAAEMQFKVLINYSEDVAIKMIETAISNGWQKFYPLEEQPKLLSRVELEMKSWFMVIYEEQTNISYEWIGTDDIQIAKLAQIFRVRVLKKVAKQEIILTNEKDLDIKIVEGFSTFLSLLNDFHKTRYLTPQLLCKNFNTIIAEISHGSNLNKNLATTASDYV